MDIFLDLFGKLYYSMEAINLPIQIEDPVANSLIWNRSVLPLITVEVAPWNVGSLAGRSRKAKDN